MIRLGIICPSEIAYRRFLPSLKKAVEFEYVGVAVANKEEFEGASDELIKKEREKATKFVEDYGGIIFSSYFDIVSSDDIDAIYTPLPPALHFKWAKAALQNGKHVLIEKPSTTCFSDTQELVKFAFEKGLALHENYMFVYHNQMDAINEIVKSGQIGDVRLYRISFGFPRRDAHDFRYNKDLGGGALLDAGGYTIKLATYLLGNDIRLIAASAGYVDEFRVDIYGSAMLKNRRGIVAQVAFGMDNDYKCDLEIWGSKGTLTTGRIMTAPNGFTPSYTIKNNQDLVTDFLPADDAFLKSIERFKQCIKDGDAREQDYNEILLQERLVEEFKSLSNINI